MRKKINSEKFLRLIYESYKKAINEKNDKEKEVAQSQTLEPIDFYPSFYKGHYYFNITLRDKSRFDAFANFPTVMLTRKSIQMERQGKTLTKNEEAKILQMYGVSNIYNNDGELIGLTCKIRIFHPETIVNEDGSLNWDSNDVKNIYNTFLVFKAYSHFDNDEMKNAINTLYYYFKNKFSKENQEAVDKQVNSLFYDICKTIGESKTKELLKTIQITDDSFIADHQFSLHNKLKIMAQAILYDQNGANQLNTISYLATPRQWRKMNRRVIDFQYPYYTVTFNGGRGSQDKEVDFAASKGLTPLKVNENASNGIGFNAGKGLNAAVNGEMYGHQSFSYNDAVYDVSATEIIPSMDDKFSTEPGMKNNLTGELNDIATQQIRDMKPGIGNNDRSERTNELNDIFGTNDYKGVALTYQATCEAAKVSPSLPNDDVKGMIKETGKMIDQMLIKRLQGFKKGEGRIALPKNYLPLVSIGRIIIQATIGLPMDDAPAIEWMEEHQQMANAISTHVFAISNLILWNKKNLMKVQTANINEMIDIFQPLVIFEETFNKNLKLLEEYAKKSHTI